MRHHPTEIATLRCHSWKIIHEVSAYAVSERLRQMQEVLAKYDPNQPRVPVGSSAGGQWTSGGGGATSTGPQSEGTGALDELISDGFGAARDAVVGIYDAVSDLWKFSVPNPAGVTPDQVNIFIGGALDRDGFQPVRGSDALKRDVYGTNYYATHTQGDQVSAFIRNLPPNTSVNVIGHSWGGDTAAKIATENSSRISVLVTVDPVSLPISRPDFGTVRSSVGAWININATNNPNRPNGGGNFWAGIGGAWDDSPHSFSDLFVSAPYNHGDFNAMMHYPFAGSRNVNELLNRGK
jgi:alpha/beta hydrolase fold